MVGYLAMGTPLAIMAVLLAATSWSAWFEFRATETWERRTVVLLVVTCIAGGLGLVFAWSCAYLLARGFGL